MRIFATAASNLISSDADADGRPPLGHRRLIRADQKKKIVLRVRARYGTASFSKWSEKSDVVVPAEAMAAPEPEPVPRPQPNAVPAEVPADHERQSAPGETEPQLAAESQGEGEAAGVR